MNESFRVYSDSAILNTLLDIPITLVWTETQIFAYILNIQ